MFWCVGISGKVGGSDPDDDGICGCVGAGGGLGQKCGCLLVGGGK